MIMLQDNQCAIFAMPQTLPADKLMSLPILSHPWPYIAMDLITDMPKSQSKTVIMIIVMQFFKSLKLIPLPELPSAFCTTELQFKQDFDLLALQKTS